LDEADSLTEGAQNALRMIISNFSDTTRFILSCNDSQKIIEPIQSRCIMIRFSKLKDHEIEQNLKRVI
jgi:replication factor C subunit 2/4